MIFLNIHLLFDCFLGIFLVYFNHKKTKSLNYQVVNQSIRYNFLSQLVLILLKFYFNNLFPYVFCCFLLKEELSHDLYIFHKLFQHHTYISLMNILTKTYQDLEQALLLLHSVSFSDQDFLKLEIH